MSKREWYCANRARVIARSRAWYKANKKRADARRRAWRSANLSKARQTNRAASLRYRLKYPERAKESQRKYRLRNKFRIRDLTRERRYGTSKRIFETAWKTQEKRCAICRVRFRNKSYACVDHCHASKKFRGLLCVRCNLGVGCLKDQSLLLRKAASYVEVL